MRLGDDAPARTFQRRFVLSFVCFFNPRGLLQGCGVLLDAPVVAVSVPKLCVNVLCDVGVFLQGVRHNLSFPSHALTGGGRHKGNSRNMQ